MGSLLGYSPYLLPWILAYSWARLAILVGGKGRGECFYFCYFFPFIPVPLSSLPFSFISSTISFLPVSLILTKWPTRVDVLLNPNTTNMGQYGTCQANKCLRKCSKCTDADDPALAQNIIHSFCSIQWFCQQTDEALIRLGKCIGWCPKTGFHMAWPILVLKLEPVQFATCWGSKIAGWW